MKIIKISQKEQAIEVVPESIDDLWHLEKIIEPNDLVSAKSERKIKATEGRKAEKIDIFVEIKAEEVGFHKPTGMLRVNGTIMKMKPAEFFEQGSHHSIEIEIEKTIKIKKTRLKNYQLERLQKAVEASKKPSILLLVLDDEEAIFALVKEYGLERKAEIKSRKQGKQFKEDESIEKQYFSEIAKKLQEINAQKNIIAGPGFTAKKIEEFLKQKNIKSNILVERTNSVGITGLNELVKSGIIEKVSKQDQLSKENKLVQEIFTEMARNSGLALYGLEDVGKAIQSNAAREIVLTDRLLLEKRKETEQLLEQAESIAAKIHIISSGHEAGKNLESLNGIACLLRFSLTK